MRLVGERQVLFSPRPTLRRPVTSRGRVDVRRQSLCGVASDRRRLRCEVTAQESASLAQYNSALFQKKHSLFESCLIELVRHLDDAPFLQTLQVFNGFIFERHSITHGIEFDKDSDVFMLCQNVAQGPKKWKSKSVCAGKVGDCCDDEEGEMHTMPGESAFWGLVVKSELFPEMQGCYLMRTTRSEDGSGCLCTHYTVTRICSGIPLVDQYDASWLV